MYNILSGLSLVEASSFVADAICQHLSLKLRERQTIVQDQPAHAVGSVEGLRN